MPPAAHAAPEDDSLGTRLKRRRRELGLTLDQVADKLGTSRQTVIRWEKNQNRPLDYAQAIANLYGWSVDEVLPPQPDTAGLAERVSRREDLVAGLLAQRRRP